MIIVLLFIIIIIAAAVYFTYRSSCGDCDLKPKSSITYHLSKEYSSKYSVDEQTPPFVKWRYWTGDGKNNASIYISKDLDPTDFSLLEFKPTGSVSTKLSGWSQAGRFSSL
jgi:hypothetical protein